MTFNCRLQWAVHAKHIILWHLRAKEKNINSNLYQRTSLHYAIFRARCLKMGFDVIFQNGMCVIPSQYNLVFSNVLHDFEEFASCCISLVVRMQNKFARKIAKYIFMALNSIYCKKIIKIRLNIRVWRNHKWLVYCDIY